MQCPNCNIMIDDNVQICPYCHAKVDKDIIRCPQCWAKHKKGTEICTSCGCNISQTIKENMEIANYKKPTIREKISAISIKKKISVLVALVIIAGVCFGGETGFLVGAVTGFVSNFFFGQGPWTPWQMFAFGIIGFVAGILFKKGFLRKTKASLCIFGAVTTFVIYGGIMNPASVIMWQDKITMGMIMSAYLTGIPFDLIHALSTAFFLWFISEPMIDKFERIKVKYGLIER